MSPQEQIARLEARLAELERSNAELEAFAYAASHDLREPLRTISGFTALLARHHARALGPEGETFLGYIGDAAARLESQVDDLLALSRATAAPVRRQRVDLGDVVARSVRSLDRAITESGAEVSVERDLPQVFADGGRLEQVVTNLVGNALKFSGPGRPRVRIGAERAATGWLVTVTDDGPGVPFEEADRVFELFHRVARAGAPAGTGIGLAICKRLVEHQGGRIWVDPGPDGVGSRFCVLLAERAGDTVVA